AVVVRAVADAQLQAGERANAVRPRRPERAGGVTDSRLVRRVRRLAVCPVDADGCAEVARPGTPPTPNEGIRMRAPILRAGQQVVENRAIFQGGYLRHEGKIVPRMPALKLDGTCVHWDNRTIQADILRADFHIAQQFLHRAYPIVDVFR